MGNQQGPLTKVQSIEARRASIVEELGEIAGKIARSTNPEEEKALENQLYALWDEDRGLRNELAAAGE